MHLRGLLGVRLFSVLGVLAAGFMMIGAAQRPEESTSQTKAGGASGVVAPRSAPAAAGLSRLPLSAQSAIAATLGRDDAAYQAVARGKTLHASNPRHGFSADFTPEGVQVRTDTARWGLHLKGYGHGEASIAARATAPHATANRVEYRRGTVTEWYVNGPLGLEQGFTLQARPGGHAGGPLTLALALSGDLSASLDPAREGVTLAQAGGAPTLRYSGLSASDAAGRELRAWMDLGDGEILLRVDDTCQAGACRSLSFAWTGVLQPINGDGTSIFKLGSTVPVKFQLTTPCVPTGTFTAKIFLAKITSDILGSEVEATSTSAADTGNTFRYDASGDQYIYNLATKTFTNGNTTPLSAGTWQIRIAQYNGTTEIGTMGTVIISLKK